MDKNKKEDFIIFATADWDTPYWTNKQHMAREFSKFGHRVLYVESIGLRKPKVNSSADWKRIFFRLLRGLCRPKNVDPRIWILSPLVLPYSFKHSWIKKFNEWMMAIQIKSFTDKHKFINPYLWTYHPYILELNKRLKFTNKLIYHCVDDLSAIPRIDKKSFNIEEKNLLKKADFVFVTSQQLKKKCSKNNKKTYYFPNVVDYDHFSMAYSKRKIPEDLKEIQKPRIVYIGAISEFKINFNLLYKVISKFDMYNFIFIGNEIEGQSNKIFKEILKLPNAHHLGYKSYLDLPTYLKEMQIGLLPILMNNYTKSMSPMKLMDYIAAGLPVVFFGKNFLTENKISKKISFVNSVEDFSRAVKKYLKAGKIKEEEILKIIHDKTWRSRTAKILEIIK